MHIRVQDNTSPVLPKRSQAGRRQLLNAPYTDTARGGKVLWAPVLWRSVSSGQRCKEKRIAMGIELLCPSSYCGLSCLRSLSHLPLTKLPLKTPRDAAALWWCEERGKSKAGEQVPGIASHGC